MSAELMLYRELLADIKGRVRQAQHKAALSANAELILLYWDIGRMIAARQEREGWGTGVIPRLAVDLKNELPEEKGFSERNIKRMLRFFREYPVLQPPAEKLVPQAAALMKSEDPALFAIVPQPAAQLDPGKKQVISPALAFGIPWFHHVILIEKLKDLPTRLCYARQALEQGWSRDALTAQIKTRAHERQGEAITNFASTLSEVHACIVRSGLTWTHHRLLLRVENRAAQGGWGKGVVRELAGRFGAKAPKEKGFSAQNMWRKNQFSETFSADTKLSARPGVLPKSDRKPPHENPSIGVLPCRTKDDEVVEYALNRHLSPALVAQYETQMIPKALLREKLHEWSQMLQAPESQEGGDA